MFSYDFKSPNKEWFPEDKNLLKKKRRRNNLIFVLYINLKKLNMLKKTNLKFIKLMVQIN